MGLVRFTAYAGPTGPGEFFFWTRFGLSLWREMIFPVVRMRTITALLTNKCLLSFLGIIPPVCPSASKYLLSSPATFSVLHRYISGVEVTVDWTVQLVFRHPLPPVS